MLCKGIHCAGHVSANARPMEYKQRICYRRVQVAARGREIITKDNHLGLESTSLGLSQVVWLMLLQ